MSDPSTTPESPVGEGSADRPVIPGYEVLEELGRGGMGVVFKARQSSLKRLVALKLIRDGTLASPQALARFRIEAEAAARVQHPNVVQVYEAGEFKGRLYFAMEFVEGGSLDKHLAGASLPAAQAAELTRTLAVAVQHAHEQMVIHRDLKPANVLLSVARHSVADSADRHGVAGYLAKITDFGLARRLDSESTVGTMDGAVLGTASYMAPEQAAGRVRDIGPAVDVYALGAILYEMLTGRPPFLAETWAQTVDQVLRQEPVPPVHLNSAIPADLETICLKCLEKEPARRYASAGELADDLGRFLEGRPVNAVPLSAAERLARLAARDGYEIVSEIGRGPRSTVYRARFGPLRQIVALKVYSADVMSREQWDAQLRRNAEQWAALAHPQLVPVQRAGWWDGVAYLVSEYTPHGSLAGRTYPVGEALQLAEQLAEIVCYLHRQGVVHGNLKPSNVLLAADGIPRLADLRPTGGLFLGAPLGDDPAGVAYLPPEYLSKPDAEPRFFADTYGLALILYELLTGRAAFVGETAHEVLGRVTSQGLEPPSRVNARVDAALDAFCLRCLAKNPWQRAPRAYDLVTGLRRLRNDLGGSSRAVPRW